MPKLRLRPGLAYCLIDGKAVFLDLEQDRYFQINRANTQLLLATLQGCEPDNAAMLVAAGLVVWSSAPAENALIQVEKVQQELKLPNGKRRSWRWILTAFALLLAARIKQIVSPADLLRDGLRLTCLPSVRGAGPDASLVKAATAYESALRLVPFKVNCVVRSHALRRLLLVTGLASRVVIGVKSPPFGAHCWLEHDGRLLGDRLEYVAAFTPLAVVP